MNDQNFEVLKNKLDGSKEERNEAALEIIKSYGNSNDPEVLLVLGKIYKEGYGVTIDYPQAFYYFREGSKQNHGECQLALSDLYLYGKGCKKSNVKAVYYLEWAYKNNAEDAQTQLKVITEVVFRIEKYAFTKEDLEWLDKKGDEVAQEMKEKYPKE